MLSDPILLGEASGVVISLRDAQVFLVDSEMPFFPELMLKYPTFAR